MNLYQIHQSIEDLLDKGFDYECIDMETGEILEEKAKERLVSLALDETTKIENTALYIKNLSALIDDIREEEKALASRRKAKERKQEWLKDYISGYMLETDKVKFETAKCALSFRKSEVLDILNEDILYAYAEGKDLLKYKDPELDKAGIKKLIKNGENVPGAKITEKQNLQIK